MNPLFQHLVDTYESETKKTESVWRAFTDADLPFRPHERSGTVGDIMTHQLLSERRFFADFIGSPEPAASAVLPANRTVEDFTWRLSELAIPRLAWLASLSGEQWLEQVHFFDVERERIWVFWRRVLHSAHHRTQLTVYLRLLDRPVPSTYGPTADVTWAERTRHSPPGRPGSPTAHACAVGKMEAIENNGELAFAVAHDAR